MSHTDTTSDWKRVALSAVFNLLGFRLALFRVPDGVQLTESNLRQVFKADATSFAATEQS